jgi:putative methyltransferase (TIGR04325 family)
LNARLKHILRQILPPFAIEIGKRVLRAQRAAAWDAVSVAPASEVLQSPQSPQSPQPLLKTILTQPEWEAVPDSDLVWSAHEGWAHQSIADTQRSKWPAFLASVQGTIPFGWSHEAPPGAPIDVSAHNTIVTFGHVLGRAAMGRSRLSVLDWGGGVGHYFVYARRLMPELALDYVVKDLPTLCAVGREVLPEAAFVSDENKALDRRYDLVFASSSLQYNRDFYGVLDRLCQATAGWLFVTRSPFVRRSDDFVVVQRPYAYGYLTEYPAWFVNRQRFIEFVEQRGLVLQREFMLGERPHVPNAPEQCSYCGFLFKRVSPVA